MFFIVATITKALQTGSSWNQSVSKLGKKLVNKYAAAVRISARFAPQ